MSTLIPGRQGYGSARSTAKATHARPRTARAKRATRAGRAPRATAAALLATGLLVCGMALAQSSAPWTLEALLEPDPGPPPSQLGAAVAINQKRAAVGNRRNHDLGTDTGRVHCYDQVRKAWRPAPSIRDPAGCVTCDFGAALDMDGDRLVIGAPRDGALGFEAGRAHVYVRRGNKWALESTLTRPRPEPADLFGSAVAISGRVAVIGTPYADADAPAPGGGATPDCGVADVFEQRDGRWVHAGSLTPPAPATSAWFGAAVAIEGDLIAIGAYGQSDGSAPAGAVHLYRRGVDAWALEQSLLCPWPGAAWFGFSLAIDGGRLLIGAPRAKAPGSNESTGAAFLYERGATAFTQVAALGAPWLTSGDAFGFSVAIDRDAVFVGATGDDEAGDDAGAVYLFSRLGESFRPAEKVPIPGSGTGDRAATCMSTARGRLIVGRGGNIEVDPRPGEGYAWVFTSPMVSPPPPTSAVNGAARAPTGRRSQTRGRSRRAIARGFRSG